MKNRFKQVRRFITVSVAFFLVATSFVPSVKGYSGVMEGVASDYLVSEAALDMTHVGKQGPKRHVDGLIDIDSTSFVIDFDKTYPKGVAIERLVSVSFHLEDDDVIEPDITDYHVSAEDRSHVTIEHSNDDLAGEIGSIKVNDVNIEFDYTDYEQMMSIEDVRDGEIGTTYTIQGVITAYFEMGGQTNMYVQDESAGILLRGPGLGDLYDIGDKIEVTGELDHFRDMLQLLISEGNSEVVEQQAGLPTPKVVSAEDFEENGEMIEAQLVMVEQASVTELRDFDDYVATDETGEFIVLGSAANVEEETDYDYMIGVVNYHFYESKLMPRFDEDLIEDITVVQPVRATPDSSEVVAGSTVSLSTFTNEAEIYYTTDGSDPTVDSKLYEGPIDIVENVTIKAFAVKEGLSDSVVTTFEYTILPEAGTLNIYDIQGSSHVSPYENMTVREVPGIVTYTRNNGFYMQSEESDGDVNTSEGIYVYRPGHEVTEGDAVLIDGQVIEYEEQGFDDNHDLTTTQIVGSSIDVVSSENPLPDPVIIGEDRDIPDVLLADPESYDINDPEMFDATANALDFYESLEGMLIEIPGQITITGPQKYNEVTVISEEWELDNRTADGGVYLTEQELNTEVMFMNVPRGTIAKTGDFFEESIEGVVGYNYGNYKIQPVGPLPELQEGDAERREETTIAFEEDKLTVATYNVENYYPGVPEEKTERLANSMANELGAPDIITLVEVMDNDGDVDSGNTDASESYQTLIDEIAAQGGPNYAYTDVAPVDGNDGGIPGGNIRVGHIYRTDRVHIAEGEHGGPTDAIEIDENGDLNYVSGLIEPTHDAFTSSRKPLMTEFVFKGESVYVIGNHWNSKRGDDAPFGMKQPPVQGSRDQRKDMAEIIHEFVSELKSYNEDANVVVLGDFNDFPWSGPVQLLEGNDMLYNTIYDLPREQQFTYNYNGSSQSLDSILVSEHLRTGLKTDIMTINSQFMEAHGRASDHDPMMVQLKIPDIDPDYEMGDVTPPEITFTKDELNNNPVIRLAVGDEFVLPEVTAIDDVDGDLTDCIEVTSNVDMSQAGTYEVRYTVSDEAGNTAVKLLTVIVGKTSSLAEIMNGSFEEWEDDLPNKWFGDASNIARSRVGMSEEAYRGDYSAQLINESSTHNRFTSHAYAIKEGASYEVSFKVKGNGEIRNGMYAPGYHGNNYSPYSQYTLVESDEWQNITWEYDAPGHGEAELIFSIRETSGEHLLIDDVVITKKD
jgi:predicted extracellular nuclease